MTFDLDFCMCISHDHSSQGIDDQDEGLGLRSKVMGYGNTVDVT